MKMILLLSLFLSSISHAKIVVLGEVRQWREQNQMCWDFDGSFREALCAKKTYECVLKKSFNNLEPKDLFLSPPPGGIKPTESLNAWVPGFNEWDRNADTRRNPPWIMKPGAPPGADVVVYSTENNQFHIYGKFKAPEAGDTFLSERISAYKKVNIKFKDDKHEKVETLEGHLLNTYFYPIQAKEGLEFTLPEGKYVLDLHWYGKDKKAYSYEETFIIPKPTGTKHDLETISLVLTSNQFKEKVLFDDSYRPLLWDQEKKTLGSFEYNSSYENEIWGIESVKKLFLNGKDVKNLFEVKKGQIVVLNKEAFLKEMKDPFLYFDIEGSCAKYFKRYQHDTYGIYSKPNESSDTDILGSIKIYTEAEKLMAGYFDKYEKEKDPFEANLKNRRYLLHRIVKENGKFVDLGPGPWGPETWVKLRKSNKYLNKTYNSEDELNR